MTTYVNPSFSVFLINHELENSQICFARCQGDSEDVFHKMCITSSTNNEYSHISKINLHNMVTNMEHTSDMNPWEPWGYICHSLGPKGC